MIITDNIQPMQRSGITGERQFGIAMTSKLYSLLSEKLYTNRIGSVVREVCSNAWDAQKMRSMAEGKPMVPFTVSVPTSLFPHFVVEDSGPGMPDEVAQNLYSTLGMSTKEGTNDQIGAFGLGSKSPFAVTDSFSIENTYEGVTYYYMCFKTENGMPSLLKTGERVEDRPNGVKVIVPSSGHNYQEYRKEVIRQLMFMEPKPVIANITDFEFEEPISRIHCPSGFVLSNATSFSLLGQNIYAMMGSVLYPVDQRSVALYTSICGSISRTSTIILKFNIGDLEPLPSREGLSYDEKTIKSIKKKYDDFYAEYKETVIKEVTDCTNIVDAWVKMGEISNALGVGSRDLIKDFVINGIPLTGRIIDGQFPKFNRKHMVVDPFAPIDQNGSHLLPTVEETISLDKFEFVRIAHSDTRLNINRDVNPANQFGLDLATRVRSGGVKIILMDEVEPKYRTNRLKSIFNSGFVNDASLMVTVNRKFAGDHYNFDDYIAAWEKIDAGISSKFIRMSKIERVKPPPTLKNANDTVLMQGVEMTGGEVRGSSCKGLTKARLQDIADGNDDDIDIANLCYVTAFRNDLVEYGKPVKDISEFGVHNDITILVVKSSGMDRMKFIKSLGIPELTDYLKDKLRGYEKDDSEHQADDANAIYSENLDLFTHKFAMSASPLVSRLKKDNQYVHDLFGSINKIADIRSGTRVIGKEERLISSIRKTIGLDSFKDETWFAGGPLSSLKSDFNVTLEDFNKTYPQYEAIMDAHYSYIHKFIEPLYEYVCDYNTLKGKNKVELVTLVVLDEEKEIEYENA